MTFASLSRTERAAVLLLCFPVATQAFSTVKPLSLACLWRPTRNSNEIPGRAPVDVFYVDDESSKEHSAFATKTGQNEEEYPGLVKDLMLEVTLDDLKEQGKLLNEQRQQLSSTVAALEEDTATTDTKSLSAQEALPTLLEKDIPAMPTLSDYRNFALPCFGLLLSGPLLSLVDTAFVGLSSTNSMQLAALGPATTLFDCLTWLLSFLNVATTNLYSSALAKGSKAEAEGVVRTGARVGLTIGIGVMAVLVIFCKPILSGYMGAQAAATPGLLSGASTYLLIRALSMPSFLLMGVLQSALLGAKDSVTPLKAILYSTVVNVLGDYLLVSHMGMGLKGAAIATTVAQWAATLALIMPARKKLMEKGKFGLLNFKDKSAISVKKFMGFAAPVITLLAGKLGVFGFLTQAAARVPGQPTPLASHQLILSLFIFLCPFVEVINQTAQTYLPPFYAPVKDYVAKMQQRNAQYDETKDAVVQKWQAASSKVSSGFMKSCFLVAAVVATLGSVIPMSMGHLLTGDVAVQQAIKPLAKFLWWSTFLMGPMSATEGILLARHKTWFLASMYMVSTSVFPYAVMTLGGGSIAAIWTCFSVFQGYRATIQTLRVMEVTPRNVWNKATKIVTAPFHRDHGALVA